MTYGHSSRAFAESEPAASPAATPPAQLSERPWQALSRACRLALIEQALRAANDEYPLAL